MKKAKKQYYIVCKEGRNTQNALGYWSEDARAIVKQPISLYGKYTKEEGIVKALKLSREFNMFCTLTNSRLVEVQYLTKQIEQELNK